MPKSIFFIFCLFLIQPNVTQANDSYYKTGLISKKPSPLSLSAGFSFREWDSQLSGYEDNGESLYGINLKLDYELSDNFSFFTKYTLLSKESDENTPYSSIDRPTEIQRKDLSTAITFSPWKKRFTPYIFIGASYFSYYSKEYESTKRPDTLINREDEHGLLAIAGLGIKLMTKYIFWELEVTTDNSTHLGFRELATNVNIGISI